MNISVDYIRTLWKKGSLGNAIDGAKQILTLDYSIQEKLTIIHTMINDCYSVEQKEALVQLLDSIYTCLRSTRINYASIKDILNTLFRIRNNYFQQENNKIFIQHLTLYINSEVFGAWDWIRDAIEFANPVAKDILWNYLCMWINNPPFTTLTVRDKCKYQFYACELLLQEYRNQHIISEFLLGIAENDNYSTYIRGDALDILFRNKIPVEYQHRIAVAHNVLRTIREDAIENIRLQNLELGLRNLELAHFEQAIAGTTFDDSQNVHATAINEAIKESLLNLMNDPETRGNTVYKVADDIKTMITGYISAQGLTKCNRAQSAIARYISDPAVFTDKRIKLGAVLVLVWNRILKHADYSELCKRLIDELSEAYNTCATGHLSRIVSVLVGYYPDIKQFVSFETQLDNNIKARIATAVRKAPEDIQGDLFIAMADDTCEEYTIFVNFLKDIRDPIYQELYLEFVPEYMSQAAFDKVFTREWPHQTS